MFNSFYFRQTKIVNFFVKKIRALCIPNDMWVKMMLATDGSVNYSGLEAIRRFAFDAMGISARKVRHLFVYF